MARDYIAAFKVARSDLLQYGRQGMRWGIRRSSAELRAAGPVTPATKKPTTDVKAKASSGSSAVKSDAGPETPAARYARLESQARSGKSRDMSEEDLKFFNARTDAIKKVDKMFEQKPTWLQETTREVVQSAAKMQMQNLANTLANKYIGDPIAKSIKGANSSDTKKD